MNKTAIKNFAVWARRKLIADITYRAGLIGISEKGIAEPLSQSTKDMQFFDIGTKNYAEVSGGEIAQRNALVSAIKAKERDTDCKTAFQNVVEEIAYTWFNRMIAVRFMEVNDYLPSRIRVLSSENPAKLEPDFVTTPFDTDLSFTPYEKDRVLQLKDENKLDELFRLLFIKQCNRLGETLPELFEKTSDYTELLLTISFTDKDGVVYHLTHDIAEDDFNVSKEGQVEIIGWMYQFYNTEQNELVYDGTLSKSRIPKELVPAATTIYTPDWAVHYMVENSLGRLWLEGHDNDSLKDGWKYYLDEAKQEPDVEAQLAKIRDEYKTHKPEDIKVIDPCMGSGHILVYAFDVLMQIYTSQGYVERDAAKSIVENNLFGLDINERAYQLAYFAVMMKARQYNRRILSSGTNPNLYAIDDSSVLNAEIIGFISNANPSLKKDLQSIADDLVNAKEYGSIIDVAPVDFATIYARIDEIKDEFYEDIMGQSNQRITLESALSIIKQAQVMAQKYDVVVTNPPYLGSSRFSPALSEYVNTKFPDVKSDLSMVMYKRALSGFAKPAGFVSFITTTSWMFLSSFEKLRNFVLNYSSFTSLVDFGTELFDGKVGHNPIVAWVNRNSKMNYQMTAVRLVDYCYARRDEKQAEFFEKNNYHYPKQDNFSKIPGSPIAYWVSETITQSFDNDMAANKIADFRHGMSTSDNNRFLRFWTEVSYNNIGFEAAEVKDTYNKKWFAYLKGGSFRKWYGNFDYVVNWQNDGAEIKAVSNEKYPYLKGNLGFVLGGQMYFFKEGYTWSSLTSGNLGIRKFGKGCIFDAKGQCYFTLNSNDGDYLLGFYNSCVFTPYGKILAPTVDFNSGVISKVPILFDNLYKNQVLTLTNDNIKLSKLDWDSFETSWNFKRHPLVDLVNSDKCLVVSGDTTNNYPLPTNNYSTSLITNHYKAWEQECNNRFNTLKANEEELSRIFIDIYGLQDELTPEVEDKDVTVHYIADTKESAPESLKSSNYLLTKKDVVKSLISYAVGCMFGRYSLDVDGLAYAGGEWDESKYKSFIPDSDNCIPITDEEYFGDDIVGRFVQFLKTVYSEETLEENLDFIASALGGKGNTSREIIRNYFLNDFIKDHIKTYQKRPIYWMFDSGKQNGFKALVYMHRYNADTVGNVRVEYLHRIQRVYESEIVRMQETIDNSTNARDIAAAEKRKEKLTKQLKEAKDYDAKIAHIALSRIDIDLDDGVKVNYEKVQTGQDGKKIEILAKI